MSHGDLDVPRGPGGPGGRAAHLPPVVVLLGGPSAEHDVSVVSGTAIADALRDGGAPVSELLIDLAGRWWWLPAGHRREGRAPAAYDDPASLGAEGPFAVGAALDRLAALRPRPVVFPALHGPFGEDGTVQGLLELANIPYVGAGVLGSAVGMDKAVMKTMFAAARLPIVPHITVLRREWERDAPGITGRVATDLGYPVFVKPANLGSSVGISKAKSNAEFAAAMTLALQFDRKIVVEAGVANAREIECAVLGNDDPATSLPGEIVPSGEFYDYTAKYIDGSSTEIIPAVLTDAQVDHVIAAVNAFPATA